MLKNQHINNIVNFFICFFFLAILALTKGYNYSPFMLAIIGLIYLIYTLIKKQKVQLVFSDKLVILGFIFYFMSFLLSVLLHGDKTRILDNPSKILLFLPLLFLFRSFPIKLNLLLHAIPIGAFISGLVALYHRFILHKPQAFYTHMHIQGGDIAMSIAMFSLIITCYFAIKKQYKLTALYLFFSLMGLMGSFLSTARGAWIGLPFIILFILWTYRQLISKKLVASLALIILLGITSLALLPNTQVATRFHQATTEISAYFGEGNGSTSVGARFDMWKSALLQIQQKPLLGWGHKNALENRLELGKQGVISEYASQFSHVHNQYLDDFSKRGLVGLLAFLAVLLIPFVIFYKQVKSQSMEQITIALLGCVHIISVVFYCLSQGFLTHNSGTIFYFFLIIVFYSLLKPQKNG